MNKPKMNYHTFVICGSHRSVADGSGLLGCGIKVLCEWLKTFEMNVKSHSTTDTAAHPRCPNPTTFFSGITRSYSVQRGKERLRVRVQCRQIPSQIQIPKVGFNLPTTCRQVGIVR